MDNHLLLSAATSEGQIFGTVLVVLLAVLGVLIVLLALRSSSDKKSAGSAKTGAVKPAVSAKKPEEKKAVLLGSLAREEQKDAADGAGENESARNVTSIDKGYAAAHGMWVCGYCEVLNDNALNVCQACGQIRSR